MRMKTLCVLLSALALFAAAACGPKDVIPTSPTHPANPDAPTGKGAPDEAPAGAANPETAAIAEAEQAAYQAAWPVFEKYCANCHSSEGKKATPEKLDHFQIDSYP